jgi:hypothetical protein
MDVVAKRRAVHAVAEAVGELLDGQHELPGFQGVAGFEVPFASPPIITMVLLGRSKIPLHFSNRRSNRNGLAGPGTHLVNSGWLGLSR